MQARHLSSALLTLGVLVGVVAVVGLLVGFEPARLPAALLNVAAYKLTFLAAFGLLAAGAVVTRYSRRADERAGAGAGAGAGLVSAAGGAPAAATPTRVAEAAEPRPGRPSAG
jgi:uncharacterized membrane protein HdeD (DUF308 family)